MKYQNKWKLTSIIQKWRVNVGHAEKDENINHIVTECSKLTQNEYKNRNEWVGKMIYKKLYNRLNFEVVYAKTRIRPSKRIHMNSVILRYKRITKLRLEYNI